MEPRITRQTIRTILQDNIQHVDHNKEISTKDALSLANTGDNMASNTSFKKSVGSASSQRKRKHERRIIEQIAKVAKVSVSSTNTTDKKNKQNSKAFAKRRTGEKKRGKGRPSTLQHPGLNKNAVTETKHAKPEFRKRQKSKATRVNQRKWTPLKITTVASDKITTAASNKMTKRQKSKSVIGTMKYNTQLQKIDTPEKNPRSSKPSKESRRSSSMPNVHATKFKQRKEIVEQSPCIRPFLSLKPDLDRVTNICCVDQNTFWIGDMSFGSIMKVKYNSFKTLTIVKVFTHSQCNFYDFCYDRKKDHILYTDRSNNSIMSISSKYEMKKLKSVKPLYPTCITVTPDDFIFVGLVDEYSYEESRSREIVKMAKNGTVVMRIPSIQDNLVRFTMPHQIAIHPNNDIVVAASDKTGGMMLSFDSEGQHKFKNTVTSPGVTFTPFGFTISKDGNIICCNEANGEFYILNAKGQLMKTVQSNLIGISVRPWSLAFDTCGHLLIGTANTPLIYFAEYFDG
ncbi:uncharacterized protein LOC134687534 isoform X2 [Mytilus trossulus]|uniref:uncharacterized protein LOC134687534 isoform X2 n=1 Tax=Mytilus trossulus TaxID=6551 RepID=UPI003005615B